MGFIKDLFMPDSIPIAPSMPDIDTVMTNRNITDIMAGNIRSIPVRKLILKNGENCLFCDYAVQINEKLCVVARHGNGYGASFRICRGLTWHTGTHTNQQIRDKVPEYTKGKLYITNKRIVFSADSKAFQKTLSSLISYRIEDESLMLQFTGSGYRLFLPVVSCAEKVLEYLL